MGTAAIFLGKFPIVNSTVRNTSIHPSEKKIASRLEKLLNVNEP